MLQKKSLLDLLSKYRPSVLTETPQEAAVMIILLTNETDTVDIVLTCRAMTLPTYAGHYSFPGGMREENDQDLYATAQRETYEELDLHPDSYQPIGQLDDFRDHDNNRVRPFVCIMEKVDFEKKFKASAVEISGIYFFSLEKLSLLKNDPRLYSITRRRPSYAFVEGDVFVWGLTAAILVHFYNIISGKNLPYGQELM